MMFNKEGKISICAVKAQGSEVTGKAIKPVSRGLLKPIGRLVELAHMIGKSGINKARRLQHVDVFL